MLVALAVLSIGLLGIAALQAHGMGTGRSAQYLGRAVYLTRDMTERIRSNPLGLDAYAGSGADNGCSSAGGVGTDCTPGEMAAHDLFLWEEDVRSGLPNGEARIEVNSAVVPPNYRLSVGWDEPGASQQTHAITIRASVP